MIDREQNITDAVEKLAPYLEANVASYRALRRRAVLGKANNGWSLLACTVEAITNDSDEAVASRQYPQVMLYEDRLSHNDLLSFVKQVSDGQILFGSKKIVASNAHRQWSRDQVPLRNIYMARAGQVFTMRFEANRVDTHGALLTPNLPYYPDVTEAVRDWLPFPMFHGSSDSRNGEIILLLPETRAYFEDVEAKDETVVVAIAGARPEESPLLVKGAWWDADGIHHFETSVAARRVQLAIPPTSSRLEYVLTDQVGTIYDYQCENDYRHDGLGRNRSIGGAVNLVEMVREACQNGEGLHVEFKPFIDLDDRKRGAKLNEIVRTVVSFANASGGHIFLGISDDCEVQGIEEELSRWAKATADPVACEKYLGALRARVRNDVVGEPELRFLQISIDNRLVAIVAVSEAREKPVCIRQDKCLYMRRGSSNAKIPPDEWKGIVTVQERPFRL